RLWALGFCMLIRRGNAEPAEHAENSDWEERLRCPRCGSRRPKQNSQNTQKSPYGFGPVRPLPRRYEGHEDFNPEEAFVFFVSSWRNDKTAHVRIFAHDEGTPNPQSTRRRLDQISIIYRRTPRTRNTHTKR